MEIQNLFAYFCSVQHRMAVSPNAAALFCYLLGEIDHVGEPSTLSVSLADDRICGTIHMSKASLRKCREQLIAMGMISFSSSDNGKSLSVYTINDTAQWKIDFIPTLSDAKEKEQSPDDAIVPNDSVKNATAEIPEISDFTERSEISIPSESSVLSEHSECPKILNNSQSHRPPRSGHFAKHKKVKFKQLLAKKSSSKRCGIRGRRRN